jgi:hypothetical protein
MQFSNLITIAACLALSNAAPAPARRAASGDITFHGAAGAQYTITVPLDGSPVNTNNALSISTVSSSTINVAANCLLHTVDFTPALVLISSNTWAVGPPQTVINISCKVGGSTPDPSPKTIVIEFDGADPDKGAKYTLTVPLDGSTVLTSKHSNFPLRPLFLLFIG